jgi:two-component system NtrC family response regulator
MGEGKRLTAQDLELTPTNGAGQGTSLREAREKLEAEMIRNALKKHGGKITAAAADLGISRPTLYEMMEKLGVSRPE